MPGASRSVVVGGGILPGAPFTAGQIPLILQAQPPILVDSILRQTAGGGGQPAVGIVVGATDPGQAGTAETFRTAGGFISQGAGTDSFIGGRGAAAAGADSVVIGREATQSNAGAGGVVLIGARSVYSAAQGAPTPPAIVGYNNTVSTLAFVFGNSCIISGGAGPIVAGQNIVITANPTEGCVAIGNNIIMTGAGVGGNTVVGSDCSITGANNNRNTFVGHNLHGSGAGSFGGNVVVGSAVDVQDLYESSIVGRATTVGAGLSHVATLGSFNDVQHNNCILLGFRAASISVGCLVAGSQQAPISTVLIGNGDAQAAPQGVTFRLTSAAGNNVAGAPLTIAAGRGTGTAAPGALNLQTSEATGSGATLQALRTALQLDGNLTADETPTLIYDVSAGTLARVSRGAADSGGVGFRVLRIPN